MEFKFTINTDNLNDPDSIEEAVADFKLLIRFLQRANPNYYLLGNMLNEQLEQQFAQLKQPVTDVPRFLKMLDEYKIPAEYCAVLFKDWCSCEGFACLAEDCMHIQADFNINMTPVWEWMNSNDASPDTNWKEETAKYQEAITNKQKEM